MPNVGPGSAWTRELSILLAVAVACLCLPATVAAGSGANAVPYLDLPLLPTSVKPGSAAFKLTVNGAGFATTSVVNWNGSPRSTSFVNNTQLIASILASDVLKATTAFITVSTAGPGGGISNVAFLHVINREPAVGMGIKNACSFASQLAVDLNGDGKLDLVSLSSGLRGTATVYLGLGNGNFETRTEFSAGKIPMGVVSADFNGDGKLDLAIASSTDVRIYLGNGNGTFPFQSLVKAGGDPEQLVAGDFNEDGFIDLAVMNADGTITILLGNGDGTFRSGVEWSIGQFPVAIAIGDFNGDGHLDLVGGGALGPISVALGNGDGSFQNPIETILPSGDLEGLAIADLNGDNKLDLVAANGYANSVMVFLGNGDGTFGSPIETVASGPRSVAVGDFNGDNVLDIAVTLYPFDFSTSILPGKGDGTFGTPTSYFLPLPSPLVVGDFNNDGRLDVDAGCVLVQTPRAVTTSRGSLNFAQQTVGTTSPPKQFKLTNSGTQVVNISGITSTGDFAQTNSCPATLDIFKGCIVTVTFTPSADGSRTGSIVITDDVLGSPQTIALTGSGVQ